MFNPHPINKQIAIETFTMSLWKARKNALLSRLIGKTSCLKSYVEANTDNMEQRRYLGVMEIPTDNIVGTVGRHNDFDGRFRPLKKHLKDRWVSVAVRAHEVGWPAIELLKVGGEYFVVDGHHRTSYARSSGIAFIDAEVWEIVQDPVGSKIQVIDVKAEMFTKSVPENGVQVYECDDCCLQSLS